MFVWSADRQFYNQQILIYESILRKTQCFEVIGLIVEPSSVIFN